MTCYVWISRRQLTDAHACSGGLALFDSLAAMQGRLGKVRIRWDALSYLWLERETRFASWLYHAGIVPMPNLARAYLAGANLAGANLADADLGNWERGPDGYARRKAVA